MNIFIICLYNFIEIPNIELFANYLMLNDKEVEKRMLETEPFYLHPLALLLISCLVYLVLQDIKHHFSGMSVYFLSLFFLYDGLTNNNICCIYYEGSLQTRLQLLGFML